MAGRKYTNNDLANLIARNDEYYRNSLARLGEDAQKTEQHLQTLNGSVGRLKTQQLIWKGVGIATLAFMTAIVIPLAAWNLSRTYDADSTIDKRISTAINSSLINYGLIRQSHL